MYFPCFPAASVISESLLPQSPAGLIGTGGDQGSFGYGNAIQNLRFRPG
jgi:hypothetical protein